MRHGLHFMEMEWTENTSRSARPINMLRIAHVACGFLGHKDHYSFDTTSRPVRLGVFHAALGQPLQAAHPKPLARAATLRGSARSWGSWRPRPRAGRSAARRRGPRSEKPGARNRRAAGARASAFNGPRPSIGHLFGGFGVSRPCGLKAQNQSGAFGS